MLRGIRDGEGNGTQKSQRVGKGKTLEAILAVMVEGTGRGRLMRCISFAETTQQIRDRTKTVTRRTGWDGLRVGDRLLAVEKYRGVRKDDRVDLGVIEVVSVRKERLDAITQADVVREGFPDWTPAEFVEFFCRLNGCEPGLRVNRIEFRYVDEGFD